MQMIQIFYVKYKYRETNWFSIEEINSMKNLHPEMEFMLLGLYLFIMLLLNSVGEHLPDL